jgi:hypothetical protein
LDGRRGGEQHSDQSTQEAFEPAQDQAEVQPAAASTALMHRRRVL